jgi:hypothetical protein
MKSIFRITAIALASSVSAFASAGVIDFTSTQWAASSGTSYSAPGSGVTLTASGTLPVFGTATPSVLTYNAGPCGNTSVGLACAGAGIGIDRTQVPVEQANEINSGELLKISFASLMTIDRLDFLNLSAPLNLGIVTLPGDTMSIRVNGTGAWQDFTPSLAQAGGYYSAALSAFNVSSLEIRGANVASEGSLARISYVPTPGTAALLLLGVAAVVYKRRKAV